MMTALKFVFSLTCLFVGNMAQKTDVKSSPCVRQTRDFVSVKVGDNVTFQCFYEGDDSAWLYWFKRTRGQKPNLIAFNYVYDTVITFNEEFKDHPRFTLDTGKGENHVTIKDLDISDLATYYWASNYLYNFEFAEGTTVSVGKATMLDCEGESLSYKGYIQYLQTDGVHRKHSEGSVSNVCVCTDDAHSPALVYCLSGAFASTTILTVLLVFLVCIRSKTHSCPCIGTVISTLLLIYTTVHSMTLKTNFGFQILQQHFYLPPTQMQR
uniref:Ig-like domain-containing protein n=1 Tax=Monopterus albus TaxID=43700 RepID=A0A3Q3IBZ9_MONAL